MFKKGYIIIYLKVEMYNISNENDYYLSKEEAETQFKEKMIKEINYYLKNYKDKFEEEK